MDFITHVEPRLYLDNPTMYHVTSFSPFFLSASIEGDEAAAEFWFFQGEDTFPFLLEVIYSFVRKVY